MYPYSSSGYSVYTSNSNPFSLRTATRMCQSTGGVTSNSSNNGSNKRSKAGEITNYYTEYISPDFSEPSDNYKSSSNNWNHGKKII